MIRNVDLNEISDGKLYRGNDMVKADCQDCKGCSACCRGMGDSILLDPLDVHRLRVHFAQTFEELLQQKIELHVVDGIILPNLKMEEKKDACVFLDENGRCSIHGSRPGFCRLFPLGRYYENRSFWYFLQIHECSNPSRTKIKVKKWIDTPEFARYESYINTWHYFLKDIEESLLKKSVAEQKKVDMQILEWFYVRPFDENRNFYDQVMMRIENIKKQHFNFQ